MLGSAGSIGTQTLEVIARLNGLHERDEHPTRYDVVALATGANARTLAEQGAAHPGARLGLRTDAGGSPPGALVGADAAERLVRETGPDLVVSAIVGSAGLPATLAAVERGADVALANKETLVAAGGLVTDAARRSGARLLPVDSEHAAIWQAMQDGRAGVCPPCRAPAEVARVVLTASGGAFRDTPAGELARVTPARALEHPTWSMGDKITVDCATLANKALEVIEAHWLFGLEPERLGVLVHRQSIVHSLVEYRDGNVLAQLGTNDMRIAIQHALAFPARLPSPAPALDLARVGELTFEEPDPARFPALSLAWRVMRAGGTSGAVFNAGNEEAVAAFLGGRTPFTSIAELAEAALDAIDPAPVRTLGDVLEADAQARAFVRSRLQGGR